MLKPSAPSRHLILVAHAVGQFVELALDAADIEVDFAEPPGQFVDRLGTEIVDALRRVGDGVVDGKDGSRWSWSCLPRCG